MAGAGSSGGCELRIRGARVIDGTGAAAFVADVAIADGVVTGVGPLGGEGGAERTIDARGRVLAPGFIDVHTHDDRALLSEPGMMAKASQGVTTVVVGNCGVSLAPFPGGEKGGALEPVPPLNLVGDYGGGGMLLAFGMVAALLAAARTGEGQVVDAAMVDGAALLMTPIYELFAAGFWRDERSANLLDGGAPFYDVYETADGEYMAVGALEPQFYAELLQRLGLAEADLPAQLDVSGWPTARERLAAVFRSKTRREWEQVFAESDACVAPVLGLAEAPEHPHNQARQTFIEVGGVRQPGTAPRFSRADRGVPTPAAEPGSHTEVILGELGYEPERISDLRAQGVVA